MKSSSLQLLSKNGIPNPASYRDSLIHSWYLEPETSQRLEVFLMRKLENSILFKIIHDGEIALGKKTYSVVWIEHPTRMRSNENGTALLSFRYCALLRCGYVLIKELRGDNFDCEFLSTDETESLLGHKTIATNELKGVAL